MILKNNPKKLNLTMEQTEVMKPTEPLDDNLFLDNDFGSQITEQLDPDLLQLIEDYEPNET